MRNSRKEESREKRTMKGIYKREGSERKEEKETVKVKIV